MADAQSYLGYLYATGQGVPKDEVEAAKWVRRAAEQNDAQAQCETGVNYTWGRGVAKDEVEAYKWTVLAADQGDQKARKYRTELENTLSHEQIAEGQMRARNFKPTVVPSARAR